MKYCCSTDAHRFQSAVRACMYNFMGLESGAELPAPLDDGLFWMAVEDPEVAAPDDSDDHSTKQVLRPDWRRPWKDNKHGWASVIIKRIQRRGTDYQNSLTKNDIAKLSRADIGEAVSSVFDGMVRKYALANKGDDGAAKKKAGLKAKIAQQKANVSGSAAYRLCN